MLNRGGHTNLHTEHTLIFNCADFLVNGIWWHQKTLNSLVAPT